MIAQLSLAHRLVPIVAAVIVLGFTVELIRRRKLREEYAMLWIFSSLIFLVFAVWPEPFFWIRAYLGVYYLTAVLILTFTFLCLTIIGLSAALSRRADETCRLAQRLALLEKRLAELDPASDPPPAASKPTSSPPAGPQAHDEPAAG